MNFTAEIKRELLNNLEENSCCKIAMLSSIIRTCGGILYSESGLGFELVTELKELKDKVVATLGEMYDIYPNKDIEKEDKLNQRVQYIVDFFGDKALEVLKDTGIISSDGGINFNIDKYILENECCKRSFVKGAFLGSGVATMPLRSIKGKEYVSTGYHLEFSFSSYQTASDFCDALSEASFLPKMIERKNYNIVYFKKIDSISDILAYMGASNAVMEINETMVAKDVKNNVNRKFNCEMGNLTKQVDASLKQIDAIMTIDEILGLDSLKVELKDLADMRLNNTEDTMGELAEKLGITKSCLNHRMRKIICIYENLNGGETK